MHMFTDTLNVYKTVSQVLCFQCNTYSDFSKSAPATSHNYKKCLKKKPKTNTETKYFQTNWYEQIYHES